MVIFFSQDINITDEWKQIDPSQKTDVIGDLESLLTFTEDVKEEYIVIGDYDSVATEINKLLTSNQLFKKMIVLEKVPEIVTGKMLIARGIKAYGNSRMLQVHYQQMLQAVKDGKTWTYPELTASVIKDQNINNITPEAQELLEHRLTAKEQETVMLILKGFSNDAIAHKLGVTTRTVKAHISSIFEKLHVSDRVSLILLLK